MDVKHLEERLAKLKAQQNALAENAQLNFQVMRGRIAECQLWLDAAKVAEAEKAKEQPPV